MAKKPQPSNLELQVLSVLWERGPQTVREALEAMPDGKPRAYTTMLSVLQVMEKKGLLTHTTKGNAHVYKPAVGQRQTVGPLLRRLVANVFGGRVSSVLQHLLHDTRVDEAELAALRRMIAEAAAEKPRARKGDER